MAVACQRVRLFSLTGGIYPVIRRRPGCAALLAMGRSVNDGWATGFEHAMMTAAGIALLMALIPGAVGLGLALTAAEKRGWIRQGRTSGSTAFAVVEEIFSPSAAQARQVLQEQKRIGQRAPAPGDGLGDRPSVTGGFAGRLTVTVKRTEAF